MAEENQEPSYEVKDKRRVNPDGTLKEEAAKAEEPEQEPKHEHAEKAQEMPEMPPPNVYETLQFLVGLLAEQAWMLMGLQLAPGQKEPIKDMTQAKLAIDTVAFLTDKLNPHLSEDDRSKLRSLVSNLQMNFVSHS